MPTGRMNITGVPENVGALMDFDIVTDQLLKDLADDDGTLVFVLDDYPIEVDVTGWW